MSESSKKFLSWLLIFLLAGLMLAVGAFAGYKFKESQSENEKRDLQLKYLQQMSDAQKATDESSNDDAIPVEDKTQQVVPALTDYSGKFLNAKLPSGWTIVEYENGNGSSMLVQGDPYQGLTGVYVNNPSAVTVFKIQGVYGIGGTDQCETYAKFSDFNQADYDAKNATNIADFGQPISLLDLTGQTYTNLSYLGVTTRRVGEDLYWDKVSGNNTFESACGMELGFLPIKGLTFSQGATKLTGYASSIKSGTSAAELLQLDGILNSLVVK